MLLVLQRKETMTSVDNSYLKLFMEDLISWKEELFCETNDQDIEHLGQTYGLGEGKSLSNCFSPVPSLHSLYSTPRKFSNLTLNCRSLGKILFVFDFVIRPFQRNLPIFSNGRNVLI